MPAPCLQPRASACQCPFVFCPFQGLLRCTMFMEVDTDGIPGLMDVLPDAVVLHVLSNIKSARDVAACSCVCKRWREFMSQALCLHFARNIGDEKSACSDRIVTRMVLATAALQQLTVYCHFSPVSLVAWISHAKSTLRHLELRVDDLAEKQPANVSMSKIDELSSCLELRVLQLWGVLLSERPRWQTFSTLHTLEIVGARLKDLALHGILSACPALVNLSLLGCSGVQYATVEMAYLKHCRLDFYGTGDCCIKVVAPSLEQLEVQGASCLHVVGKQRLHHLSIANNAGKVKRLEFGILHQLKSLFLRGVQWGWKAVMTALQIAPELEVLSMRVEFCGEGDMLEAFPEVDFVDFFSAHSKLKRCELHGAIFAALSQKNSLAKLTPFFSIDSLERGSIMVRSPVNAEQKLATLEALLKCSPKLEAMVVKVSQMKNCEAAADELFAEIAELERRYRVLKIE
ncbi:hypothetical protein GOP47_0029030 [Adiantum capillus-veneris]|nr:hypothetical protein GOP47_0029030 [Adiantum capillus-veneris]